MRPAHYRTRNQLTDRQQEVLGLMARGFTNPQIADALGITLDGAKFHVTEILTKLDVASRDEAAALWRSERRPVAQAANLLRALATIPLRWLAVGAVACGSVALVVAVVVLANPAGSPFGTPTAAGDGTAPAVRSPCAPVDGPGFIRLNGITYVPVLSPSHIIGWDPASVTLGSEFGRVLVDYHMLPCDGAGRTPVDGDALGLAQGQPLYQITGFDSSFRLAAR